jgi:carbon storage regulator
MLVLTRKTGQKMIIDDTIEVTIVEVRGDTVKIGINAPKHVGVYRHELYAEIKAANQAANQAQQSHLAAPAREQLDELLASLPQNTSRDDTVSQ